MEKIERPKKLSRNESAYQNNDDFQTNANNQFNKIYDKLDELVDEDTEKKKKESKAILMRSGSKIISATNSNGAQLFTKAEMQTLFGITDGFSINRVSGCVVNGDTGAFSGNFLGLRIATSNGNIYVHLDQTVSGTVSMRCNYTLFYNQN